MSRKNVSNGVLEEKKKSESLVLHDAQTRTVSPVQLGQVSSPTPFTRLYKRRRGDSKVSVVSTIRPTTT